ncbi:MAG: hydrogenase [Deltaproteobacteria bacterium]|nr:hydrogenase [Deltaproteobacteria bacterium]
MSATWNILAAIVVLGLSGLPAYLLPARSETGQRVATAAMVAGSLLGLCGVAGGVGGAIPSVAGAAWGLPYGRFSVAIDAVSAVFLALVFVVPALGSIYGLGYWGHAQHRGTGRRLGLFYGLLAGSMALVLIARDGVLFLIAWEAMAMAAYFAASVEEDDPAVRRAGWVYLIATHAGTLCLIAMFALWRQATGSFALEPAPAMAAGLASAIFVLALFGFGFKAGLMPLHVWLPGAHSAAPSHVSAVMSGVMLKMGVYGIVRMTALLPVGPPWWGGTLLVAGAITGLAGIAFAIGQHDLKRLLAYSSIENIGIIAMGLGLAVLGRALGRPEWVLLGLGGALLHTINHGLFKPLLFLGAGAVIHCVHTRELDRLGGLARRMPAVTGLFVIGSVAICALPPLNGFASEWLIYLGLFRTVGLGGEPGFAPAAVAAVVLAMIGAMAVACFAKLIGTVFLGSARSDASQHGHDPTATMMGPMIVLAFGCVCLGLFPSIAIAPLEDASRTWAALAESTPISLAAVAPLGWISAAGLGLVAVVATFALISRITPRAGAVAEAGTWDCGYARPDRRMQYTGSSLGATLVDLFGLVVWPRNHQPAIHGLFPGSATFKSVVADTVLDRLVLPFFRAAGRYMSMFRVFQQAQMQSYVLYVLTIVIVLMVWGTMGAEP